MAIQDDLIAEASGRLRIKHGKDVLDVPEDQAWKLIAHELVEMVCDERRKARGP